MAITVACLMPMACGGGGGEWQPPVGRGVIFTPDEPNPGPMTISMGAAAVAGNAFQIPIVVTGIDNFFGAAFHVNFDPSSAEFLGYVHEDNADYFIEDPAGTVVLLINAVAGAPGEVLVNATTAAVLFDDRGAAGESLATLRSNDHILSACVYSGGKVFSCYVREDLAGNFANRWE